MKSLPPGTRVLFHGVDPETTEEEFQQLILARTGLEISLDRISIRERPGMADFNAAISLSWEDVSDLLAWALSEDQLHGRPICIARPQYGKYGFDSSKTRQGLRK
jgi:hypothetical protein